MASATPIQSDLMLWSALRTRRRRIEPLRGIDAKTRRWMSRAKHAKMGMKYLRRESEAVVAMESEWAGLKDEVLDARMAELRDAFARHAYTPEQLRAGLAGVREIAFRETGEKPYMVQIMGALGLFKGQIVEMITGEGKTLTAAVAATLMGWLRRPIHVITVNDYLAQRDADSRQPIFRRAGLTAGAVVNETPENARIAIYRLPIVYVTQKELVADWLRDQLRIGRIADPVSTRWLNQHQASPSASADNLMVPGLYGAIVDEVDAVLIDEAVTPLIIAQPREVDSQSDMYERARDISTHLRLGKHFTVDLAQRRARLTNAGSDMIASLLVPDDHAIWKAIRRREELVEQAIVAEHCYLDRQHYQVVDGCVMIVDEYTGRFMPDRKWQHGLHQAVEAKHHLEIAGDRDTVASMSFQRFFLQYPHLCGMTGTASDAKGEMETTYGLPVRLIPTNRPLKRTQLPPVIFATAALKWEAVADEVERIHHQGRPVLVGTRSVEASELLSSLLKERKLDHQVLNAVHHKVEAQIVEQAGAEDSITVATNMAGRGTDIKLGPEVAKRGGLHVILTERHTARRVDRQLAGRAGRQGDPGSSHIMISLEDDLVMKFAPRVSAAMRKRFAGWKTPLPGWVMRLFDGAQWTAQHRAVVSRVQVLRHDEDLDRSLPR